MTDYPQDDDGDTLRAISSHGSDMTKPMDIDFTVPVPDEATGHLIAERAAKLGYHCTVYEDSGDWDCVCTRSMIPTYEGVVRAQRELDEIARPHGASVDGWGTLGNSDAV